MACHQTFEIGYLTINILSPDSWSADWYKIKLNKKQDSKGFHYPLIRNMFATCSQTYNNCPLEITQSACCTALLTIIGAHIKKHLSYTYLSWPSDMSPKNLVDRKNKSKNKFDLPSSTRFAKIVDLKARLAISTKVIWPSVIWKT